MRYVVIAILAMICVSGCAAIKATNADIEADPAGFTAEKNAMEGTVNGFLPAWAQLVGLGGVLAAGLAYGKRLGTNLYKQWQAGKNTSEPTL